MSAMALEAPATTCLLLVCGLPGSGKSSFCHELLSQGQGVQGIQGTQGIQGASWIHFCYDDVERALRADRSSFDPETWQAARAKITADIASLLDLESESNRVIVLDDNMYYRSMRKQWYHLCRDRRCAYHQVFLQAPTAICLERNRYRDVADRVPDFSIEHMAEVFEWPPHSGNSWEAQEGISVIIDAETPTLEQVQKVILAQSKDNFWRPVPKESVAVEEVQSDSHNCDVALRKIVTRALAGVPKELGPLKSTLAKQWGARKAEYTKQVAKNVGGTPASDLIQEAEVPFLQSCVADLQQALRASATGPAGYGTEASQTKTVAVLDMLCVHSNSDRGHALKR